VPHGHCWICRRRTPLQMVVCFGSYSFVLFFLCLLLRFTMSAARIPMASRAGRVCQQAVRGKLGGRKCRASFRHPTCDFVATASRRGHTPATKHHPQRAPSLKQTHIQQWPCGITVTRCDTMSAARIPMASRAGRVCQHHPTCDFVATASRRGHTPATKHHPQRAPSLKQTRQ
jgi:hypothetical protein